MPYCDIVAYVVDAVVVGRENMPSVGYERRLGRSEVRWTATGSERQVRLYSQVKYRPTMFASAPKEATGKEQHVFVQLPGSLSSCT